MRCGVLGAGSWGTALAMQLARCGHEVILWDHRADRAEAHQALRENRQYLPGLTLPPGLTLTGDLALACEGVELLVTVVPSSAMRGVMGAAAAYLGGDTVVCCASKGVEQGTLLTMDELLRQVLYEPSRSRTCALSGPSFAAEVARDLPTAVVVAAHFPEVAQRVAEAFHGSTFRVYTSDDVVGVEIGGAVKNVMAIACGLADGMGLGHNARAAIITRGLAEITRLAVARGANPLTLAGLAGMGDLVLTCTGDLSRNRRVGLALGRGQGLSQILAELGQVAEGVVTAQSAWDLGHSVDVDMPITDAIHGILYEGKPPRQAMMELLGRRRKAERD